MTGLSHNFVFHRNLIVTTHTFNDICFPCSCNDFISPLFFCLLTFYMLRNFFMNFRHLIIFKVYFSKSFFEEYHQDVKQFGSRSGPTFCQTEARTNRGTTLASHFVGPDLGPNCLQRLSADDTSRQRVNFKHNKSN